MHTYIHDSYIHDSYIHTYTHTPIHTYIHTHTHTHIHTYIQTYIHTYIHTHIHTYIHTYTHTYIHTYTHTHTYIHTHMVHIHCAQCRGRSIDLEELIRLSPAYIYDSVCMYVASRPLSRDQLTWSREQIEQSCRSLAAETGQVRISTDRCDHAIRGNATGSASDDQNTHISDDQNTHISDDQNTHISEVIMCTRARMECLGEWCRHRPWCMEKVRRDGSVLAAYL
jgi:hypothetical protein